MKSPPLGDKTLPYLRDLSALERCKEGGIGPKVLPVRRCGRELRGMSSMLLGRLSTTHKYSLSPISQRVQESFVALNRDLFSLRLRYANTRAFASLS